MRRREGRGGRRRKERGRQDPKAVGQKSQAAARPRGGGAGRGGEQPVSIRAAHARGENKSDHMIPPPPLRRDVFCAAFMFFAHDCFISFCTVAVQREM